MGQFPTGVTAITTVTSEGLHGFTANAVCKVSDRPPLVLVSVERVNRGREYLAQSGLFAVNILSDRQEFLAERLAGRAPGLTRRFEGVAHSLAPSGAPLLSGSLGWLDCSIQATHEAGDHTLFLGRVEAAMVDESRAPLLFFRSRYARLSG
jgi:3-hydroxy-9,10-secoandrosta-1,3,5(10)-triene-9,17-dione monooxygenase reductase component